MLLRCFHLDFSFHHVTAFKFSVTFSIIKAVISVFKFPFKLSSFIVIGCVSNCLFLLFETCLYAEHLLIQVLLLYLHLNMFLYYSRQVIC